MRHARSGDEDYASHGPWCGSKTVPMRCAYCHATIFWFTCEHGCSVLFDRIGGDWPKHLCFENPETRLQYVVRELATPAGFLSLNRALPNGVEIHGYGQITSCEPARVEAIYPRNSLGWRLLCEGLGGSELTVVSVVRENRFIYEDLLCARHQFGFRPSDHVMFTAATLDIGGRLFLRCLNMHRMRAASRRSRRLNDGASR